VIKRNPSRKIKHPYYQFHTVGEIVLKADSRSRSIESSQSFIGVHLTALRIIGQMVNNGYFRSIPRSKLSSMKSHGRKRKSRIIFWRSCVYSDPRGGALDVPTCLVQSKWAPAFAYDRSCPLPRQCSVIINSPLCNYYHSLLTFGDSITTEHWQGYSTAQHSILLIICCCCCFLFSIFFFYSTFKIQEGGRRTHLQHTTQHSTQHYYRQPRPHYF
jgi:hypothetical protein